MADNTALVDIGGLAEPATVLIKKISSAVGGVFEPWQIRRVAQAEADAEIIRTNSQIEISELQRRALHRFLTEEEKKQSNMEAIIAKALPDVKEDAQPQNIDDDWIANFFDKSRLISNEEMQTLWSKILAGEANAPGIYSKRTVNFLASLDRSDVILFQALCSFIWIIEEPIPLIFDTNLDIYNKHGINFNSLMHLDEIGLMSFDYSDDGYFKIQLPKNFVITYYEKQLNIEFDRENGNRLPCGMVISLSKVGQEFASICGANPIPEFFEFVFDWYTKLPRTKVVRHGS